MYFFNGTARTIAANVPAALRSWGFNCTPSGLSPAVFVPAKVWVVTPPPNFAKSLVRCWHFFLFRSCVAKMFRAESTMKQSDNY
jgi:hypothetical protein